MAVSTAEAVELMMNAGAYDALNRLEELITGLELPQATEKALFKGVADLYEGMSQLVKDAVYLSKQERAMTTETNSTVVIPAGTLIHVGGLPFRTITDTTVGGSESNLKHGLEALAQPHTASEGVSYTMTHDASKGATNGNQA